MKKLLCFFVLCFCTGASSFGQLTLVWSDEFDGSTLDMSKWQYETGAGGWGNNESQFYTSGSNVDIDTGYLHIIAKEEQIGSSDYTSSRIITKNLFQVKYGKIEARMKLPMGQGLWPAFWMLGANISTVGWPMCGEIDIMEHVNNETVVNGTIHWDASGHQWYGNNTACDVEEFHDYSIVWDNANIKWYLDGVEYHDANILNNINGTSEFHAPFFLILNLAVGGNWPGYPDASTIFPATVMVDYVRVYVDEAVAGVNELNSDELNVYPNPANDVVTVQLNDVEEDLEIEWLSAEGNIVNVKETISNKNQITFNIKDLESGIYYLKIKGERSNQTVKISKID